MAITALYLISLYFVVKVVGNSTRNDNPLKDPE